MLVVAYKSAPHAFPIEYLHTQCFLAKTKQWEGRETQFESEGYNHRRDDQGNWIREIDLVLWCVEVDALDDLLEMADDVLKIGMSLTIGISEDDPDFYEIGFCEFCRD